MSYLNNHDQPVSNDADNTVSRNSGTSRSPRFARTKPRRAWIKILSATAAGALLLSGLSVITSATGATRAPAAGAATSSDTVTSVPVATSPTGIAVYRPAGQTPSVYVASSDGTITFINPTTNKVTDSQAVGTGFTGQYGDALAIAIAGNTMFASMKGNYSTVSGQVIGQLPSVLTFAASLTQGGAAVQDLPVGAIPQGVASSPDGKTVYAVNSNDGTIIEIDTATNTVTGTLTLSPVVADPDGIGVSPDGSTLYVTSSSANAVSFVNASTGVATGSVTVGSAPSGVGVGSDGTVYVANSKDGTVSVIDPTAKSVTGTIAVGSNPQGVAVYEGSVYVANQASGTVSMISVPFTGTAPKITSGALPDGTVGADYGFQVTASGDPAATFTATGLPAGLSIDSATGVISGSPTQVGSSTVTVKASNGVSTDTQTYTLTVAAAALVPTSATVTADPGSVPADGISAITVTATVLDQNGNPMPNVPVRFVSARGTTVTPASVTTDGSGVVTVQITSEAVVSSYVSVMSMSNIQLGDVWAAFTQPAQVPTQGSVSVDQGTSVVADGLATHTVEATVLDASNQPVANRTVGFTVTSGATLSVSSVKTDSAGVATVSVSSSTPGSYSVTASLSGVVFSPASVDAVFVTGPADAGASTSSWVVTPQVPVSGDGASAFTGTVTVTDATGNPVNGASVLVDAPENVTVRDSSGTELGVTDNQVTVITDNGVATVSFTSTEAGTYQVGAYVGGAQIGSTATLTFTAGLPANAAPSISTDSLPAGQTGQAYGPSGAGFTVVASGTPAVRFTVTGLPAGLSIDATTGLISGTPTLSGSFQVVVTVSNGVSPDASRTLPLTITAVASMGTVTTAGRNTSVWADGSSVIWVEVQVSDQDDNPVSGVPVVFTSSSPDTVMKNPSGAVVVSGSPVTTDGSGGTWVTVSSSTPGSYSIVPSIPGVVFKPAGVLLTFTPVPLVATQGTVVVDSASGVPADGASSHTVTATVTDANGQPVANVPVAFTVSSGATLSGSVVITNALGQAPVQVSSTTPGTYTVTPSLNGVTFTPGSVGAVFTAPGADASKSSWVVSPGTGVPADGSSVVTGTVTVRDAGGTGLNAQSVLVDVPAGVAAFSGGQQLAPDANHQVTVITGLDGTVTVTFTSTASNTYRVGAYVPGTTPALIGDEASLVFTTVNTVASAQAAGNPVAVWAYDGTVYAVDTDGTFTEIDPLTNQVTGTDSIGNGFAAQYGSPLAGTIAGNRLFASMKGNYSTIPGSGQTVGQVPTVLVFSASLNSGGGSVQGLPADVVPKGVASSPDSTTVYVVNANDGTVLKVDTETATVTGILALSPAVADPDGIAVSPDGGTLYVTSSSTGTVSFVNASTGAVTGSVPVGSSPSGVGVAANDGTLYVANSGDGTVSIVDPVTKSVTGTVTVGSGPQGVAVYGGTVYVANQVSGTISMISVPSTFTAPKITSNDLPDGTVDSYYGGSGFRVTASGSPAPTFTATGLPTGLLIDSATGIITGWPGQSGTFQVTVTVSNGVAPDATATYPVVIAPAPVYLLGAVSIDPGTVSADGVSTGTVTVTVKDASGAPVANVEVGFRDQSGTAVLSASSATTNGQGVATIQVSSTVVGPHSIVPSASNVVFTPGYVTFTFVPVSSWVVTPSGSVSGDGSSAFTGTVTVLDATGKPVGANVLVDAPQGVIVKDSLNNELVSDANHQVTVPTDPATGQASVSFTSTEAGTYQVGAYVGGTQIGSKASLTFTAGLPANAAPSISTDSLPAGQTGQAYGPSGAGVTVTASGIPASMVFTATGLPSGLSINSASGLISGTPTQPGSFQVVVTASNGVSPDATKTLPLTVTATPSAGGLETWGASQAPADGTTAVTVLIDVWDQYGNPVSGVPVTLTVSPSGAVVKDQSGAVVSSGSTVTTPSNGEAVVTVTSSTPGSYSIVPSAAGVTFDPVGLMVPFTQVPQVASQGTVKVDSSAGVPADGASSHTVTATVTDANGQPVANVPVGFTVSSGATLSAPVVVTNAQGVASVNVTSTTAGTYTVTPSVSGVVFTPGSVGAVFTTVATNPGSNGPSLSEVINTIVNAITNIVKTIVNAVIAIRNLFSR